MKLKKHEEEYFECIKNYIGNNLKNFIKSLISSITNEKKIIQCEKFLNAFKLECEKQKDEYFLEEDFDLFIKSNDENYINLNDKTIRRIIKNNQSTYIFLCLLVAFVNTCLKLKKNYEFVKNIMILEYPTIYCRASLTKRIANKINVLQMKNFCSFVFSTHSSQLFFEIANSLRLSYTKDDFNNKFLIAQGLKINEKLKYRLIENNFTQEGINSRNLEIIINCCFSENVILVEGLKDYELANQIIKNNNQLNDYLCDVYDCNSKGEVIKVYTYLWQHKIIEPFAFVDIDNDPPDSLKAKFTINNKESFFYAFDTTLEEETKDSNPSSKNNLKWYTFQNIQKCQHIKISLMQFMNILIE
ncbi:TOPRIM nucleotidyl transferase/hydrolase domain-containing protein [Mycoplasmopsis adleri]|uniref:TOPRIM nucleotidyl transferase/hydrolase domain-containing protein n=1 Tax=Mycoplasmopsis adleri TaxID=51362 RepID=UPI0038738F14